MISNTRELSVWREMLVTILERVRKSAASGKSIEKIKEERLTREWDDDFPESFVTSDHVIEEAFRQVIGSPAL